MYRTQHVEAPNGHNDDWRGGLPDPAQCPASYARESQEPEATTTNPTARLKIASHPVFSFTAFWFAPSPTEERKAEE